MGPFSSICQGQRLKNIKATVRAVRATAFLGRVATLSDKLLLVPKFLYIIASNLNKVIVEDRELYR